MNTAFLLNLSLALHLIGLGMSIGMTLTKYLSFGRFFAAGEFDKGKWMIALGASGRLTMFLGIGMGLAILSGALMMHLAYATFMHQFWFQLKISVLAIIIIAGIIANRHESKLRTVLKTENKPENKYLKFPERLKLLSGIQFALFIVIILLASFRFV